MWKLNIIGIHGVTTILLMSSASPSNCTSEPIVQRSKPHGAVVVANYVDHTQGKRVPTLFEERVRSKSSKLFYWFLRGFLVQSVVQSAF
jgi:hypothetical protein